MQYGHLVLGVSSDLAQMLVTSLTLPLNLLHAILRYIS